MKKDDICAAFCERVDLREVPIGYAIKTPFRRPDGDSVAIYLRRNPEQRDEYRVEDDGETIALLEASGADLDSETRFDALASMLKEYDGFYSEAESLLHTRFVPEPAIPSLAVKFSALILRVQDLSLLSSNRARSTFRDDLIKLVEAQFGLEADILLNAPLQSSMKDYIVDIIVRSTDGRSLAIYAGTSELKALEALLFEKEMKQQRVQVTRPMLVLETAKPREIKDRTLSRVMNSDILLASMDGEELAIKQKMAQSLRQH